MHFNKFYSTNNNNNHNMYYVHVKYFTHVISKIASISIISFNLNFKINYQRIKTYTQFLIY